MVKFMIQMKMTLDNLIPLFRLQKSILMKFLKYQQINFYIEQDLPIMQIRKNLDNTTGETGYDHIEKLVAFLKEEEYL